VPVKSQAPVVTEEIKQLKSEMLAMGFSLQHIELALSKSKTQKLDEVVEIIFSLQAEDAAKPKPLVAEPIEVIEWKPYNCETCTFYNA
jgi:hypothetical protein